MVASVQPELVSAISQASVYAASEKTSRSSSWSSTSLHIPFRFSHAARCCVRSILRHEAQHSARTHARTPQAILNALRAADVLSPAPGGGTSGDQQKQQQLRGLSGRLLRASVESSDAIAWPSGAFDEEAFEFVLNGLVDGHLRLEARLLGFSLRLRRLLLEWSCLQSGGSYRFIHCWELSFLLLSFVSGVVVS